MTEAQALEVLSRAFAVWDSGIAEAWFVGPTEGFPHLHVELLPERGGSDGWCSEEATNRVGVGPYTFEDVYDALKGRHGPQFRVARDGTVTAR